MLCLAGLVFSSIVFAQGAPSPKKYEDAGICAGAYIGQNSRGGKLAELSPVAQANLVRISKEIGPKVDTWSVQQKKCYVNGKPFADIARCIDETVPDKNAALYWKGYTKAAEFVVTKPMAYGVEFTNSMCVHVY